MRGSALVIALVLSAAMQAQHLDEPLWQSSRSSSVSLTGYVGGASDGLTNRFVNDLFTEELLSAERVGEQKERLRTTNRFGGDYYQGVDARIRLRGNLSLLVAVANTGHGSGRFTDDAYRLVFEGNSPYKGQTLDLGGTRGVVVRYQKLGMGVAWNDLNTTAGVRLSFINGQSWSRLDLSTAELSTSARGDTLNADVRGVLSNSKDQQTALGATNGGGFGMDLFFSERFEAVGSYWQLNVQVVDLGVVQWQPGGTSWEIDSVMEFTGVEVNDLTLLDDASFQDNLQDSLDRTIDSWRRSGTHNGLLPGWFQLSLRQEVRKGIEVGGGVTWRPTTVARTFGWAEIGYRFNPEWVVGTEVGYGGFGRLQWSVEAAYTTKKVASFVRVGNLESLVFPQQLGGAWGSVGLSYRWDGV